MGHTRPLYVYFRPFLNTMTNIVQKFTVKSEDGVLGTRNRGDTNPLSYGGTALYQFIFTSSLNYNNQNRSNNLV